MTDTYVQYVNDRAPESRRDGPFGLPVLEMLRYMVALAAAIFGLPITYFYGVGSVSPLFLLLCICIVLVERGS